MLIAQANLRETPSFDLKNCLKYFVGDKKRVDDFYKSCQDTGLRRVVEGVEMLKNRKRPSEAFWSQLYRIKTRRQAMNLNLNMLFANDIRDPFGFEPSLSETLFLFT